MYHGSSLAHSDGKDHGATLAVPREEPAAAEEAPYRHHDAVPEHFFLERVPEETAGSPPVGVGEAEGGCGEREEREEVKNTRILNM